MKTSFLLIASLFLACALPLSLLAQNDFQPQKLEFSIQPVLWKTEYHFSFPDSYQPSFESSPQIQLTGNYRFAPRWSVGLSYLSHSQRAKVKYTDPQLRGTSVLDTFNNTIHTYHTTEHWASLSESIWGIHLQADLIRRSNFYLQARLGASFVKSWAPVYHFDSYTNNHVVSRPDQDFYSGWQATVSGGVGIGYAITPYMGLSLHSTVIQGFSPRFGPESNTDDFRYANVSLGIDLKVAQPQPQERANTIMLGVGFPFGISYERQLWAAQNAHSIRVFAEYFLPGYQPLTGVAYNIRFGQKAHSFMIEPVLYRGDFNALGLNAGIVRRRDDGLFLRADAGIMGNELNVLPRLQFAFGYSF